MSRAALSNLTAQVGTPLPSPRAISPARTKAHRPASDLDTSARSAAGHHTTAGRHDHRCNRRELGKWQVTGKAASAWRAWRGSTFHPPSIGMRSRRPSNPGSAVPAAPRCCVPRRDGGRLRLRRPTRDGPLVRTRSEKADVRIFRKLRYARRWAIEAQPDSVELKPRGRSSIPETHHFGKRDFVRRAPDGKKIFTRYSERRLLGFGDDDRQAAIDVAAALFETQ